jgi:hypothetical protein
VLIITARIMKLAEKFSGLCLVLSAWPGSRGKLVTPGSPSVTPRAWCCWDSPAPYQTGNGC